MTNINSNCDFKLSSLNVNSFDNNSVDNKNSSIDKNNDNKCKGKEQNLNFKSNSKKRNSDKLKYEESDEYVNKKLKVDQFNNTGKIYNNGN